MKPTKYQVEVALQRLQFFLERGGPFVMDDFSNKRIGMYEALEALDVLKDALANQEIN